ncbi:Na+/H+ antiporter subunit E [Siccirubricoccus deserti]
MATIVAMTRAGIDAFWAAPDDAVLRVGVVEIAPVMVLLALCIGLTVGAGPAMRYMEATAATLHAPAGYVRGILSAAPGTRGQPMRRWLPFPLVAAALLAMWLLLNESVSPGAILLGGMASLGACLVLVALDPPKGRFRRLRVVLGLAVKVLAEIIRSNNAVARLILRPGSGSGGRVSC